MREKLHIDMPVIVEGRYDKNVLLQLLDATVLTTDGFAVFNSKQKQQMLRRICREKGVILLTDPDGGGRQIRAFLLGILPRDKVYQLHIPRVAGKERRKKHASRSGTMGVEGMTPRVLLPLFAPFASDAPPRPVRESLTKYDLYTDGLSGKSGAAQLRRCLCLHLGLPDDLTADGLLEALNLLYTPDEYRAALLVCKETLFAADKHAPEGCL